MFSRSEGLNWGSLSLATATDMTSSSQSAGSHTRLLETQTLEIFRRLHSGAEVHLTTRRSQQEDVVEGGVHRVTRLVNDGGDENLEAGDVVKRLHDSHVEVASNPDVGSSMNNTEGEDTISIPMLTRFFCPPEIPRASTPPTTVSCTCAS